MERERILQMFFKGRIGSVSTRPIECAARLGETRQGE